MAPASLATAAALVLLQLVAAQAAPIGLPGCNTTCGDVSVPYPFGFQPGCYRSGYNLTCDTSNGSPRLLLGDGTLRVVDIFIQNATVRVLQDSSRRVYDADNITFDGLNVTFATIFAGGHYRMSYFNNEIVLFGCEVVATLVAGRIRPVKINDSRYRAIGCVSFCSSMSGNYSLGYCQASYTYADWYSMPTEFQVRPLESRNNLLRSYNSHVSVFLAEQGWLNVRIWEDNNYEAKNDIPLILRWDITQGLPLSGDEMSDPFMSFSTDCPRNVALLCKSNHSGCTWDNEVYQCRCRDGYDGNPYVDYGCQDIDECKHPEDNGCFGDCTNTDGSFECRCLSGTFGDATVRGGCVKTVDSSTAPDAPPQLAGMAPAPIGLPKCETTCGHVHVPYPFGFGTSRCYLPGFDLTCDTSQNPPRLLLGGGNNSLQVVGIFLNDSTMRVIQTNTFDITNSTNSSKYEPHTFHAQHFDSDNWHTRDDYSKQVGVHFPDIGGPYMLSARNELIVTGCNVEATLHAGTGGSIVSCVSNCSSGIIGDPPHTGNEYCSGRDGCCHVRIPPGSRPKNVKFQWLFNLNMSQYSIYPPLAFVAEEGQIDRWYKIFNRSRASDLIGKEVWRRHPLGHVLYTASKAPLVLSWVVKQNISMSAQSDCSRENGSYTCHCQKGYHGNPYFIGGCQDIDECKIPRIRNACFGNCNNLNGSYECRCPRGTQGNPYQFNGCIANAKGLIIGLSVGIGTPLLLLVLQVIFIIRKKVKQRRIKLLRQKHFDQNRGQLLQQLVYQRADIAERMIISMDELEKATNNFDKARELGGGGHGTVYKGILSDQHVVAIKKSKITVQKEINEFINEIAILSQVNHRNVVKLLGCCLEIEVPMLVYEFISNGTLYQHLHVEGPASLSWANRVRIATETANAFAYLHSSVTIPIIHRDIKSTNILLDDTLTSKVSDFGASRYIPVDKTGLTTIIQGTIGYLDPMSFCTGRLNEKSDVYSFGVILVELLTRKKPFSYESPDGDGLVMHFAKLHAKGNLAEILDPQVIKEGGKEVEEVATLAASCLKMCSDDRPTMRQVELILEGLQASVKSITGNIIVNEESDENDSTLRERRQITEESSRRYSMEQELGMSAS